MEYKNIDIKNTEAISWYMEFRLIFEPTYYYYDETVDAILYYKEHENKVYVTHIILGSSHAGV